ncbi:MAG: DNRLRE domain-containing protein [Opitutales bacterium]
MASFIAAATADAQIVYTFIEGTRLRIDGVPVGPIGTTYAGTDGVNLAEAFPNFNFRSGDDSSDGPEFTVDGDEPGGSGNETQAVLRFSDIFDVLPDFATIHSAELFIDIDNGGDDLLLYQVAGGFDWSGNTATWNNFGTSANDGVNVGTETVGGAITVDGGGDKVSIDVTEIVQRWFAGDPNNGVVFVPTGNNGVDFDSFATGKFGNDPRDRPRLNLTIKVPEPAGIAAGLGAAALAVTLLRRYVRRMPWS